MKYINYKFNLSNKYYSGAFPRTTIASLLYNKFVKSEYKFPQVTTIRIKLLY